MQMLESLSKFIIKHKNSTYFFEGNAVRISRATIIHDELIRIELEL